MSTSSPPETLQRPNEHHAEWLLRRVWDRVNRRNMHFVGAIVGAEGMGKSHTAIKIASVVDPTFGTERVIFDIAELLRVLRDGDHKPGQFYVLDEAGVQLGRRTWQERGQILANQALQLVRDHNIGLIFTLPRLGELDSQAQGRLQAFYEIVDKVDGEYVEGKWKFLDPDRTDQTGQIYRKYPRRRKDGELYRITRFSFTPPSDGLIEPYEERKAAFQQQFYDETIQELEGEEEEAEEDAPTPQEIATQIAGDGVGRFVSTHGQTGRPYINRDMIRAEFGLSHSDAKVVKSLLEQQFDTEELEEYR